MVNLIKKIKKHGESLGFDILSKKTKGEKHSYVVANRASQKAILIGRRTSGEISCYKINMKKWIWAESEGFSRDDIVDKFFKDIFIEFKINEPEAYSGMGGIMSNLI